MHYRFAQWREGRPFHEARKFAQDTGVLFVGSSISAALFLLFHMLTGRWMPGEDYAELVALIGLLNVLNVPAGVMQLTMARYVAERAQREKAEAWLLFVRRGLREVSRWGLIFLGLWCLGAPALRMELKASTTSSLMMVGVIAFVFLYTPVLGGALQGSRRFGWFVASNIGVAASRLVMVVPILLLHGGVTAILGAVALSFLVGLLISYWPIRGVQPTPSQIPLPTAREIHAYFWGVLIGQIALFALIQADLILSPRLFEGETLAAYGKAATLSRIVFFLPLPIITAMFPRAVTSNQPKIILAPLLATLLLSVSVAAVMSIFSALPMQLMYGVSDPLHLTLMRRYVWAAIPLALINILSPYLWARQGVRSMLWIIPVTFAYLLALLINKVTPQQVIVYLFIAGLVAFALLLWLTFRLLRAGIKNDGS